jgi:type II secretory pathway pseudopilin PulG
MGRILARVRKSGGFSVIEVMVAGGLLAFIAVALLPAIFSVVDTNKATGFRSQCSALVRAKLQEYLNGGVEGASGGSTQTTSGFEYTKSRYQQYGVGVCTNTPSALTPGYRETVYRNTVAAVSPFAMPQEMDALGTSPALSRELLGFQLWVMIRHYNPRTLTGGQPTRACPPATYQFFQVGDALEVTVTGMIRTHQSIGAGGRGFTKVGKLMDQLSDPNDNSSAIAPNPLLTCSSTEIIYPPRLPFRYYLSPDGKILNLQAKLALDSNVAGATSEAAEAHFRHVWSGPKTGGTYDDTYRIPLSNIRSFAVSPDNKYVWVMRPGELARYGPCYDDGTQVNVGGTNRNIGGGVTVTLTDGGSSASFTGIPDCPAIPAQTWPNQNPKIETITVDFKSLTSATDDKVYGMPNSGHVSMETNVNHAGLFVADISGAEVSWVESGDFKLPQKSARILGMFITQTFPSVDNPNLFFFDNSCYTGSISSVSDYKNLRYCTSVFNSADTNMQQEMREVPLQVEAVSY